MRDKAIRLSMERTGEFSVNWTGNNSTQCGTLGQSVISYRVAIETTADKLDVNGFIIDNNEIHAYFVEHYRHVVDFESCELIATKACKYFHDKVNSLYMVRVAISGNPSAAWLTAEWDADSNQDTRAEKLARVLSPRIHPHKEHHKEHSNGR